MIRNYIKNISKWSLTGTTSRKEFWGFTLINAIIALSISAIESVISDQPFGLGPVYVVYILATSWPTVCIQVRRLRDTGYSPHRWWWGLTPFIGIVLAVWWWTRPSKKI